MTAVRGSAMEYGGVVVPMASPFTDSERLDESAIHRILDHILDAGVAGVLLLGTTGEAASMSRTDRMQLVERAANCVGGRAKLYAGIADNSFGESVKAAKAYHRAGVEAFVSHLPVYYPLGAIEMKSWFERLADHMPGPLFLYNIPQTTKSSIPVVTVEELSHHPNIAGIKDSEYDTERMETLLGLIRNRSDFAYFAGPSARALRAMRLGADGFVPGVGNVVPRACQRLFEAAHNRDWQAAEEAQQAIRRIGDTYQSGRSVGQAVALLKVALSTLGLCQPVVLPPLLMPSEEERRGVEAAVSALADAAPAEP